MSTTTLVTADELLAMPTGMGKRYELVLGELRVMSPSGWRHGQVVNNLQALLSPYIRARHLGRGFGAETGFRIARDPDTVRAPDFAFIAKKNLPKSDPTEAFWPGAPDLAVEVLSPGDTNAEVAEKVEAWLSAGCVAVWIIDPRSETVAIYSAGTAAKIKTADVTLHGEPVVEGFSCQVGELFQ